jgi:hypothetical protein
MEFFIRGAFNMARRRDPVENVMESALQPGQFIAWNQESSFVAGLKEVEREIAAVTASHPQRAARLYEAFIAACYLKADEIDSEWEFGHFIEELACGWIKARQVGAMDRGETAGILLSWIDRDDYGLFNDLGCEAAKVLDQAGLAALEKEVQGRFDDACAKQKEQSRAYFSNEWAKVLRSIYTQQRSIEKYLAVAERTRLTPADCSTIASMFEAKRKLNDSLGWVDRGLAIESARPFQSDGGHDLAGMRRALLRKLGRVEEASESAWAEFERRPGVFTYEELMHYVPKTERKDWHEKAMSAAERGDLAPLIDLWLEVKETGRLVERLERTSDRELEELSHYATESAAKVLARTHPAVAARIFRALCMRILKAAKSKYYDPALAHLEEARKCYLAAGLEHRWEGLALEIRRDHYRKSNFMPGFNAIVAGKRARVAPSFLDRARWQWAGKTKA